MQASVRQDVLKALRATKKLLEKPNPSSLELKIISNHTLRNASVFQDQASISAAILIYSLSKVIDRAGEYLDYDRLDELLSCAISGLEGSTPEKYKDCVQKIFDLVQGVDGKFRQYIQDVISQATVKKGSALYSQGLSAARAAELMGISLWDLHGYLGATSIHDQDTDLRAVRQRLEYTRRLFA